MNIQSTRLNPITSLLLAWMVIISSLAATPQPASFSVSARSTSAGSIPSLTRPIAPAEGPEFPNCKLSVTPPCANLQIFLLIDDSSSMLYTDPTRQRLEGVKNVLDILAKEYYLPAVDARAKELPNIQVSLIHFSKRVLHNSGWKTINPKSIDAWTAQLMDFDADLKVAVNYYNEAHFTDFQTAFATANELAGKQPQTTGCPRLVMLFTDGVPNLGEGNLDGEILTNYMKVLQDNFQKTFNRSNDVLFVTTFGSDAAFIRFWNRVYKQKWDVITKDSDKFDPRRVLYVPTSELASRMERIIGSTIGAQVYTLNPLAGKPQQYATEIPITVESLRLTRYAINTTTSFTVTGPDGKTIQPDGKNVILTGANTSIQVLEILNPPPGSYQITTAAPGGLLTRLLLFEKITAKLVSPIDTWLQFANGQIGIQLLGADGKPLAISPQMSIQAALTQAGPPHELALTPGSDTFTTRWMPLATGKAAVDACVTMKDNQGTTVVLYNGPVGEIQIDPLTVQGKKVESCVPSEKIVSMPLQLINGRSQQPAAIDVPVQWTSSSIASPDNAPLSSTISEIDAKSGQYVLRFKPTAPGEVQFKVTAGAIVDGANHNFYSDKDPSFTINIQPPRQLKLALESPDTLGDPLSKKLYRWFHPTCTDDRTAIVFGRHVFGLFGPTLVTINGRFVDATTEASEPGIERFAIQLVSPAGGPSSGPLNSWTTQATGENLSTLDFHSPGLGLYNVSVTDQGKNLECTELASPPTQTVLLINDYWEYLIIAILILILVLLIVYLFRRYRNRGYGHEIPLILSSVVLIVLNVYLVNLLVEHNFECQLNCGYLIDKPLNSKTISVCNGTNYTMGPWALGPYPIDLFTKSTILRPVFVGAYEAAKIGAKLAGQNWGPPPESFTLGPLPIIGQIEIPLLPALAKVIDPPLKAFRQLITWTIIVFFALASLVISFIIGKIIGFINQLRTPQGRAAVLTNLSIGFLFFVIFCSLFYFAVVQKP